MDLQEKITFIHKTLEALEAYLLAPAGCLLVLSEKELNAKMTSLLYFRQGFWLKEERSSEKPCLYYFALYRGKLFQSTETRSGLLLCKAVDELAETFVRYVRIQDNKISYFCSREDVNDDPKILAEYIFTRLYESLDTFYGQALGFRFATFTAIAERAYEKDAAQGKIILCAKDTDLSEACCLQVKKPTVVLESDNVRLVRRLLAGAGQNGLLFTQDDGMYQFSGYLKADAMSNIPTMIELDGKGGWTLLLSNQKVFKVKGNRVYMPPYPQETMRIFLADTLGGEFCDLIPALGALSRQEHGTSVVLLNLDESYIRQWMDNLVLCGRAFQINPISLQIQDGRHDEMTELLKSISRIDGAIIVHYPTREIQYVSAIVDGQAVSGGMLDAGARHNALYAFVQNIKRIASNQPQSSPILAFVFSEDGDITPMN